MEDWDLFPDFENPFTFEYYLKQLHFYGPVTPARSGLVRINTFTNNGIIDDYFNTNWHIITDPIPRLVIDEEETPWIGHTWMTITPMEVQSMAIAIYKAEYDVYTSGLGLGYHPLACAAKDEVEKVIVYENNLDVINLFQQQHEDRPELDKIEIRQGDFLEALRNEEIDQDDYIFNDIYPDLNSKEALDHFEEFRPMYPNYDFWGIERIYLDSMAYHGLYPDFVPPLIRTFFKFWQETTVEEATGVPGNPGAMIKNLYSPISDRENCLRFIDILADTGT